MLKFENLVVKLKIRVYFYFKFIYNLDRNL